MNSVIRSRAIVVRVVPVLLVMLATTTCNRQDREEEAIRASIVQHVSAMGGFRMDSISVRVTQLKIEGSHAQAQAEFRPKQAAPASVALQVTYELEKRDGVWIVLTGQPLGGQMSHPTPAQLPPGHPSTSGTLPPTHPALTPDQTPNTPASSNPQ